MRSPKIASPPNAPGLSVARSTSVSATYEGAVTDCTALAESWASVSSVSCPAVTRAFGRRPIGHCQVGASTLPEKSSAIAAPDAWCAALAVAAALVLGPRPALIVGQPSAPNL